jgi:TldD protein
MTLKISSFADPFASLADEDLKKILKLALSRGGDFAEVYLEYLTATEILLDEDKLKTLCYGIVQGAGIRVNSVEKTGYAYSDDLETSNLKKAAEVSSFISESRKAIKAFEIKARQAKPHFLLESPVPLMKDVEKIELLKKANQAARDYDSRIRQVKVEYYDEEKKIMILNSEGIKISDVQHLVRLAVFPLAISGTKKFDGYATAGGRVDTDYFVKNPPELTAKEAARQAVEMLDAEDAPAGLNPVVVGPGWGGVLVHEAFGHSLEGDGIRKKTSLMSDKLGRKVASDVVDVVDDATIPYGRGSFNIDDEGTPGQRKLLVKNGVLQGFLYDKLNARLMGTDSTGNGRRESYRSYPIPRMSNTFIDRGETEPDDIVKSVKKGIFAKKLGGGTVDTSTGNFNFLVREGYLIEQGKITRPIKGAVLIGNGPDAMKKIELVGNDLKIDSTTGTCGKDNQSVWAGLGQPTVKFREITVGGTKVG